MQKWEYMVVIKIEDGTEKKGRHFVKAMNG
jgi:hypothetical protein